MKLVYVQIPSVKRLVTALTLTCFYDQTSWNGARQQCSSTIAILVVSLVIN